MNRRQLEYAVRLAEMRSFSRLADELHISQPALSKHIGALEQELGVKLFDRANTPLSLTPAGAYFIEEAKNLAYQEDQLIRTLEQFKSGEAGCLTIGVSPFRCMYLLPKIVRAIRDKFPGVQVILHEDDSAGLRRDAADGKFDLAILNLPVDESVLDAVPIESETLVLAVPNELATSLPSVENGALREVDLTDCKDLPFVTVGETQELRQVFDKICSTADIRPTISAQVKSLFAAWQLVLAGVGAAVLPLPFIEDFLSDQRITLYTIRNNAYSRRSAAVTRRGQYLSEYAKYALELLTK